MSRKLMATTQSVFSPARVARLTVLGVLLYPALYLLVAVPHRGWIDFYQIFSGVQALWRGQDPYATLYYYPPWTALFLGPLMLLPYDPPAGRFEAAEAWFWVSLAAFLGAFLLWLPGIRVRLASFAGATLVLTGLVFAPTLQGLVQGQSTLLLLPALAALATPWGRHPVVAGLALATLTIKPQLTLLVLCGILLRAVASRTAGPLLGFAGALAVLFTGAFLLLPDWPAAWLGKLGDGRLYTQGSPSPYFILTAAGVPPPVALVLCGGSAAVLAVGYFWLAWQGRQRPPDPDFIALGITAGLLAALYHHSYDYVLLLLPAALIIARLPSLPPCRRYFLTGGLLAAYLAPLGRFANVVPPQFAVITLLVIVIGLVLVRQPQPPRWAKDAPVSGAERG